MKNILLHDLEKKKKKKNFNNDFIHFSTNKPYFCQFSDRSIFEQFLQKEFLVFVRHETLQPRMTAEF